MVEEHQLGATGHEILQSQRHLLLGGVDGLHSQTGSRRPEAGAVARRAGRTPAPSRAPCRTCGPAARRRAGELPALLQGGRPSPRRSARSRRCRRRRDASGPAGLRRPAEALSVLLQDAVKQGLGHGPVGGELAATMVDSLRGPDLDLVVPGHVRGRAPPRHQGAHPSPGGDHVRWETALPGSGR